MDLITNLLYWISTGLMIPVIVLLIIGFAWSLLILGGLYGRYLANRKLQRIMVGLAPKLESQAPSQIDFQPISRQHPALHHALEKIAHLKWNIIHADKVLADFTLRGEQELESSKLLMRLGPMLGLMGTLIPMGPALVGLAAGDIVSMAANMQVAFATTVIGVFVGSVGYLALLFKKRWFAQDVNHLQHIIELAQDES